MNTSIKILILSLFAGLFLVSSCKKDEPDPVEEPTPFEITDHFVAVTIKPKTGSSQYTSVLFIQFLENNKALFVGSSANNIVADYTITDSELRVIATGGNARTAIFGLDEDKKITSAFYQGAGPLEYETTGELFSLEAPNQLAGKTYKGDEMGMSGTLNREGLIFNFHGDLNSYGSGTDAAEIDNTLNSYTLFGGNGFKAAVNGGTEMGFVSGNKLTVFRLAGLYFSGVYEEQ